jgi:hypothetical protein
VASALRQDTRNLSRVGGGHGGSGTNGRAASLDLPAATAVTATAAATPAAIFAAIADAAERGGV